MSNPYSDLPPKAFWRSAVASRSPFEIEGLWDPKFRINRRTGIVTAGSCFAQHIGRALVARGYRWIDAEPAPELATPELRRDYNYGVFSFRTGNIYTPKMLRQWLSWAFAEGDPVTEVWEQDGRFFDPFRPAIEPGGFASAEEVLISREVTLAAIRRAVAEADVFVFTLGLTESWRNRETGVEYAMCPGTVAGQFDAAQHEFHNHGFGDLKSEMKTVLRLLRTANPRQRVLLTVSPVPLTATASGQHVLTATVQSKSLLRAVAGTLTESYGQVDYFPSYEIITAPPFRGMFYGVNQRSVVPAGVKLVMDSFFQAQAAKFRPEVAETPKAAAARAAAEITTEPDEGEEDALRCEEELLNAFSK